VYVTKRILSLLKTEQVQGLRKSFIVPAHGPSTATRYPLLGQLHQALG